MKNVQRFATILVLLMRIFSALGNKICYEIEKIPKLVQNKTRGVEYGTCNYYCMFSEHTFPVTVAVDKLSCALEYEIRQKEVCCEGFYRHGADCLPLCKHRCVFGECVAPETCQCYVGYRKIDKFLCEPVCETSCENGQCVAPNSCLCKDGFERDRLGKCVPKCRKRCQFGWCAANKCRCYDGYTIDPEDDSNCIPLCVPDCGNGTCVYPNVCRCSQGYTLSSTSPFVCLPVCNGVCKNCVAPGVCVCPSGYRLNDINECVPICATVDCLNGRCVGPEVCQCNAGFAPDSTNMGGCVPLCKNGCRNGECIAPDVCVCAQLYRMGSNSTCEPYCPGGCLNGDCIGPGVCECPTGYTINGKTGICEPYCKMLCLNGVCSGPDLCTCNEGYQLDRRDASKCVPKCSKPCVHGKCIAPEVCECNKGYVKMENNSNVCEAKCTNGCLNGRCIGPERCECLPGYLATTSLINSKKSACTPYCKERCVNAYCIKPNSCQCIAGYRFAVNSDSICEPVCDKRVVDCTNGRCTQPNSCECNLGYTLAIRSGIITCEPTSCERVCVNGFCVGNDSCDCIDGYRKSTEYDYVCEPICNPTCSNGRCVAPNVCICNEGFISTADGTCQPFCSADAVDCSNGICLGNNQCQCHDGYYLKRDSFGKTLCVPLCATSCLNGRCVAPGSCQCNEGFEYNQLLAICEAVCNPPCEHGDCVQPDSCFCHDGFVPEDEHSFDLHHVCSPYCDPRMVDCTNGTCGGSNFCRCNEGFYSSYTSEGVLTCLPVSQEARQQEVSRRSSNCVEGVSLDGKSICEVESVSSSELNNNPLSDSCQEGYEYLRYYGKCVAICEGCEHGRCVAPNDCECYEGYVRVLMNGIDSCQVENERDNDWQSQFTNGLAELQGVEQVEVYNKDQYNLFSVYKRVDLFMVLFVSSIAFVVIFGSYMVCACFSKERSFRTETIIN